MICRNKYLFLLVTASVIEKGQKGSSNINKKRTYQPVDFDISMDHTKSENKRKQKLKQILRSCLRAEKSVEYESDYDTNCNYSTWSNWRT